MPAARTPGADVRTLVLDLADLGSVRAASARLRELDRLDVLIENAGMVHAPRYRKTSADGVELVFATNVLGHFALTAGVLPELERTPGSRIVLLGSIVTRLLDSSLHDPQLERDYHPWRAYTQSKVAMQVFGFELDRRLRESGSQVRAVVAHPGYALSGVTPGIRGVNEPSKAGRFFDFLQSLAAQSKEHGAWPIVRAAIDRDAAGGSYWGPRLLVRGRPVQQRPTATSRNPDVAARLWTAAEHLSGPFPLP